MEQRFFFISHFVNLEKVFPISCRKALEIKQPCDGVTCLTGGGRWLWNVWVMCEEIVIPCASYPFLRLELVAFSFAWKCHVEENRTNFYINYLGCDGGGFQPPNAFSSSSATARVRRSW